MLNGETDEDSEARRPRLVILIIAMSTWWLGCSSDTDTEASSTIPQVVDSVQDAISAAIDRFDQAESAYADCLTDAGFTYSPRQVVVEVATESGDPLTRTEARRQNGYGIVAGDGYRGVVASVTGGDSPSSELAGIARASAEGGICSEKVNALDVQFEIQRLLGELEEVPDGLPSDPRFLAAMTQWRSCMVTRGYPFDSPAAAFEHIESEFAALSEPADASAVGALAAKERQIATADGECFDQHVNEVVVAIMEKGR